MCLRQRKYYEQLVLGFLGSVTWTYFCCRWLHALFPSVVYSAAFVGLSNIGGTATQSVKCGVIGKRDLVWPIESVVDLFRDSIQIIQSTRVGDLVLGVSGRF